MGALVLPERLIAGGVCSGDAGSAVGVGAAPGNKTGDEGGVSKLSSASAGGDGGGEGVGVGRSGAVMAGTGGGGGGCGSAGVGGEGPGSVGVTEVN